MTIEDLLAKSKEIFWETLTDDDAANELLDLFDTYKELIQFDKAFRAAHRELNIWARTERETGLYLDQVQSILNL